MSRRNYLLDQIASHGEALSAFLSEWRQCAKCDDGQFVSMVEDIEADYAEFFGELRDYVSFSEDVLERLGL